MYNLNDIIRCKIFEKCGIEAEVYNFYDYYYSLEDDERDYIMKMMISDYYKQYMPRTPFIGNGFFSIEELIMRLQEDYELMETILIEEIDYTCLSNIEKQNLMQNIDLLNRNKFHYSIFNGHILDMIAYSKKYTLEEMRYNYLDYTCYNEETEEAKECAIKMLLEDMKYIKFNDKNKYKQIILNLLKNYYIWEKFFINNAPDLVGAEEYIIIDLIEKHSLNELLRIINRIDELLIELLYKYVSEYHVDSEVNSIVNNYILNTTDEEVIKKLEI